MLLLLRVLTYSKSIFYEIIMIIIDDDIRYDYVDRIVKRKKVYKYFEMYFSCFGPFGVWGVTFALQQ